MIENNLKQRATLVPIESKSQGWNNTYKREGTNNVYNNTLLEGEKKNARQTQLPSKNRIANSWHHQNCTKLIFI